MSEGKALAQGWSEQRGSQPAPRIRSWAFPPGLSVWPSGRPETSLRHLCPRGSHQPRRHPLCQLCPLCSGCPVPLTRGSVCGCQPWRERETAGQSPSAPLSRLLPQVPLGAQGAGGEVAGPGCGTESPPWSHCCVTQGSSRLPSCSLCPGPGAQPPAGRSLFPLRVPLQGPPALCMASGSAPDTPASSSEHVARSPAGGCPTSKALRSRVPLPVGWLCPLPPGVRIAVTSTELRLCPCVCTTTVLESVIYIVTVSATAAAGTGFPLAPRTQQPLASATLHPFSKKVTLNPKHLSFWGPLLC